MKFSRKETKDLMYAGLMISLAFAILLSGGLAVLTRISSIGFLIVFLVAFFTAGIGFLLHELMHKYISQCYGLFAEFRASYKMLWLAIAFSFFGFIIAAPGAVYIHDRFGRGISRERNGKISVAGPMTNVVLALLFLILILTLSAGEIIRDLLSFGLTINSLLAAFNMIPFMPFDGAKVFAWNKPVYWITLALGVGLFVLSWFV